MSARVLMCLIELNYITVPSLDKAWLQKMREHKNDLFEAIWRKHPAKPWWYHCTAFLSLFETQRATAWERKSIKSAVWVNTSGRHSHRCKRYGQVTSANPEPARHTHAKKCVAKRENASLLRKGTSCRHSCSKRKQRERDSVGEFKRQCSTSAPIIDKNLSVDYLSVNYYRQII